MRTPGVVQLALAPLVLSSSWYLTCQVEYSSRAINAYKQYVADEVFPWVIGCNVLLKLFYLVCRKLPKFPGLGTLPDNIEIYIGTALDVLVCYVSLLRINLSYLNLAIFPLIAIFFISMLCMRHNRLSGRGEQWRTQEWAAAQANWARRQASFVDCSTVAKSKTATGGEVRHGSSRSGTDDSKKDTYMPNTATHVNGKKDTYMPNTAALLSPHFLLCALGMLGDEDHDGNNYDFSQFFLFLTCMLLQLTIMMMRLPAGISRGIAPASELLRKASLVLMLLTAHMVAADTFGKEVVLLLLPEVVPLLLRFSLHLDHRKPIVNIQKLMDCGHFVLWAVVGAICGYILVVPKDESSFDRLYWACHSCAASGAITYIIALVLLLWPAKDGNVATLSYDEAVKLLKFWGSVLLKAAVGLLAFGGWAEINRSVFPK